MDNYKVQSKSAMCEEKQPWHIEEAEKIFRHFSESGMSHDEQVEAFKYVQNKLVQFRQEDNGIMKQQHEDFTLAIKNHEAGTLKIASAL